jgi:hypothetical protein
MGVLVCDGTLEVHLLLHQLLLSVPHLLRGSDATDEMFFEQAHVAEYDHGCECLPV